MLCSPCKEEWRLRFVSFHHKLIIEPVTQFKILPRNDNFLNGWESYPEIYKAITEIWELFVLWMTLLKCIDLHDNLADELKWAGSSRSATFQCCWPVFCVRCTSFTALKWCKEVDFFFFFTALDIHPSPEFFLISLHCSGGHRASGICLFMCWELASVNCWWKSSAFLCSSELVYLFNQQLCALGCLCPVKPGLCFHISIREGLHCNAAWSFHSTCSYAYFFICVRPDHHIATKLHQFMLGEGPCKCCVCQSTAKISPI